jgi:hypothetical protein
MVGWMVSLISPFISGEFLIANYQQKFMDGGIYFDFIDFQRPSLNLASYHNQYWVGWQRYYPLSLALDIYTKGRGHWSDIQSQCSHHDIPSCLGCLRELSSFSRLATIVTVSYIAMERVERKYSAYLKV